MKKFYLLLLILLFTNYLFAQWEYQYPNPTGNSLYDVFFISIDTGLAVGAYGTIIRTVDTGSNFELINSPTEVSLMAIDFYPNQNAIIAGHEGTILKSTDGGAFWSIVMQDTSFDFNDMCVASSDRAWAVGSNGSIYYSNNSGNNWINQFTDTSYYFTSVCFIDSLNGWVAGKEVDTGVFGNGVIVRTYNGGNTWNLIYNDTLPGIDVICFPDLDTGWVVATGKVYKTIDGGINWEYKLGSNNIHFSSLYFSDPMNGWIVGSDGIIPQPNTVFMHTHDGGVTWNSEIHNTLKYGFSGLHFNDAKYGWIVGNAGQIAYTADSGNTWIEHSELKWENLNNIHFSDHNNGWAFGMGGYPFSFVILKTTDGGLNWIEQPSPHQLDIPASIFFTNPLNGWMVLSRNLLNDLFTKIMHTSDGGTSWNQQYYKNNNFLRDIKFIDPSNGWAVGGWYSSLVVYTTDSGNTWTELPSISNQYLSKVEFVDYDRAWIIGSQTILYTNDGGSTWNQQWSGNSDLYDICFIDSLNGWVLGNIWQTVPEYPYDGILLRTNDGGLNWTVDSINIGANDIHFRDKNHGWLISGKGIFCTSDGGNSWIRQTSIPGNSLFFTDSLHGWAVGPGHSIRHTTNGGATGFNEITTSSSEYDINAYPNPFSFNITIEYELDQPGSVDILIYNQLGQQIEKISHRKKPTGKHKYKWNPTNLTNGLYYIRVKAGKEIATTKVIKLY
ncbi:YCF48-related protein [candidate division KSB1 bacterium]